MAILAIDHRPFYPDDRKTQREVIALFVFAEPRGDTLTAKETTPSKIPTPGQGDRPSDRRQEAGPVPSSPYLAQRHHQQHPKPRQARHPVHQPLVQPAEQVGRGREAQLLGPALDQLDARHLEAAPAARRRIAPGELAFDSASERHRRRRVRASARSSDETHAASGGRSRARSATCSVFSPETGHPGAARALPRRRPPPDRAGARIRYRRRPDRSSHPGRGSPPRRPPAPNRDRG